MTIRVTSGEAVSDVERFAEPLASDVTDGLELTPGLNEARDEDDDDVDGFGDVENEGDRDGTPPVALTKEVMDGDESLEYDTLANAEMEGVESLEIDTLTAAEYDGLGPGEIESVSYVENEGVEASDDVELCTADVVGEETPEGDALVVGENELVSEIMADALALAESEGERDDVALPNVVGVTELVLEASDDADTDNDPLTEIELLKLAYEAVALALTEADFDCAAVRETDADCSDDDDTLALADVELLGELDDAGDPEEPHDTDE